MQTMSSHEPSASAPLLNPSPSRESLFFDLQDLSSFDPPAIHEKLTEPITTTACDHGSPKCTCDYVEDPQAPFAFWNFSEPYEFIPSQVSQPKCAPTEDIFGNLIGYSEFVHPSRQEEDDNEATAGHYDTDVPSPLKKQQRRKLRESAGVKGTSSRNPGRSAAGPLPNPKPETSLPPAGRMQCLWGDGCPTKMDFDYTPETIKEWRDHVDSHLAESSEPTEDSGGGARPRAKRVECSWNGCDARVERERLFKHIATHEVRLKLLCSNRCGVNIRDDNLERHLKSCRLRQRGRI